MNISVEKIKKELQKNYGWDNLDCDDKEFFIEELIKDIIDVLNNKIMKKLENKQSAVFNDLRLGNVVQYPSGSIYYVDMLYKDYSNLKSWFYVNLDKNWLIKCGFIFDEETSVFEKKDIRIELVDGDFIFNYFYGLKYIKHVHELQNLYFSLNGIELTVA
jgi:hypothetical protein